MAKQQGTILTDIARERDRQDEEFGPEHDDVLSAQGWSAIRGRFDNMQVRAETPAKRIECLVKIAAVAVAQIESLRRTENL